MEENKKNQAPLFQVENLSIAYVTKRGPLKAVNEASFTVPDATAVAVIGESGCGKTTLVSSIVRALPSAAKVTKGKLLFRKTDGMVVDLLTLNKRQFRSLLWEDISLVFQASQSSFNPVSRIEAQFYDTMKAHRPKVTKKEVEERSRELLETVMLDPDKVLRSYPHEISGGMKQRTLIALSLLLDARLVILDEPTTALDLITQEKILMLLKKLKEEKGFSILFITHDLGIVSELADEVVTMYAGHVVERTTVKTLFEHPAHPYSQGLVNAIPRLAMDSNQICSIPGTPPDMIDAQKGCPFAPRCSRCSERCRELMPEMRQVAENQYCACWNPLVGGEGDE